MSKTVLYVAKDVLVAVYLEKDKWSTKQWLWNDKNITNVLKEIKAINSHWILLLSPEVSYFKKIEDDQVLSRDMIAEKLPQLFPEILASRQWDWKKLEKNTYLIEVVTTKVWKWIEAAEKIGMVFDKITTAKYVAETNKLELTDPHGLFKAVLAEKKDSGKDENVLNITVKKPRNNKTIILSIVLLLIASVFMTGAWFLNQRTQKLREEAIVQQILQEQALQITPTPEPTQTPEPQDFNLRLKNNSGIASSASEMATLFSGAGFANVEILAATNAAEKKIVKETTVHSKFELPTNIKDTISNILQKKETVYQIDMTENDVVDILIIIGS
jgi:hypothetical protein